MRRTLAVTACVAAILAAQASACGDGVVAENLRATPTVKAGLRAAYLTASPGVDPRTVGAPLSGHTYYGRYDGTYYAVATFGRYPTVFSHQPHSAWRVVRQTHGGVCARFVPAEMLAEHWWLRHWGGDCWVQA
jgi:hypothetical protein